jgi:hypothetical protein
MVQACTQTELSQRPQLAHAYIITATAPLMVAHRTQRSTAVPTKLRKLRIDRIDLVPAGANQEAHIVMFKNERGAPIKKASDELYAVADDMVRSGLAANRAAAVTKMMDGGAYRELFTKAWREERSDKPYSGPPEKELYHMVEREARNVMARDGGTFADAMGAVARNDPDLYDSYRRAASMGVGHANNRRSP